jgi:hypothetical protein
VSFVFEAKMSYTAVDLPMWVTLDYLTTATTPEIEAMVNSANTDFPAFIDRMKMLGLSKKAAHVAKPPIPSASASLSGGGGGGGGGGGAATSSRCHGTVCGGRGTIVRAGTCERCLVAMEADDKRREREARREIEAADRRRRAAELRRAQEVAEATEAAEIAEAAERRERNAHEIGVQPVGLRDLDANSHAANCNADMRRIARALAMQDQSMPQQAGLHGGMRILVHHHGGGGAPMALAVNGVPRAVFGPPMINSSPFAMPGFGARF